MENAIATSRLALVFIKLRSHLRQVTKWHIGSHYRNQLAIIIVHLLRITAHQQGTIVAYVGFTPIATLPIATLLNSTLIPRALGVVVLVNANIFHLVVFLIVLIDIEAKAFVLPYCTRFHIAWHITNRDTYDVLMFIEEFAEQLFQRINIHLFRLITNSRQNIIERLLHMMLHTSNAWTFVHIALRLLRKLLREIASSRDILQG